MFYYKGNRYEDPIDGRRFRKFMNYGYAQMRRNVLSPSTLSLERHRLLWLYLSRETDFLAKPMKVLHVAPEQAFFQRFKNIKQWKYVTTDLESPLAEIKADLCHLPFEDNSFDLILCNHVLEHIPDDKKAMKELFRVMKKGGTGIFQVPQDYNRKTTFEDPSITDPKERTRIFGQYDHVRVYGMDYFDTLQKIGFKVTPLPYANSFSDEEIEQYRIEKNEIIPICRKL